MSVQVFDCSDPGQRTAGLQAAADAVRRGQLVVLPTDTVYGIGADAFTPAAVAALLAAKGRGRDMPVPVLIGSRPVFDALVAAAPPTAYALIDAFWPGGLTIVVRYNPSLAWDLGETNGTVALRMPAEDLALELLQRTGPMAVSSANRSGLPPATTCANARAQLGEAVAVYLDGGPTTSTIPSSIVDLTGETPTLLRAGAIEAERLREIVPELRIPSAES
ncbi:MAG: threonylcarbamoyl-AMP synthase [Acidothermus cellulolyticus]|nr:threonylcarbamoyl-AMP synthase [Acidothermus cellulolyticus]